MKKLVISSLLICLLLVTGCADVSKNEVQPATTTKEQTQTEEQTIKPSSIQDIESSKREEVKELLGHSAYIIGAVLSHNYFGEVGDGVLWQNARRTDFKFDYVKFHNLFGKEMLNPESLGSFLWEIDEAYIKAIIALELEEIEKGRYRTKKEDLKKVFEFFSPFLTEEVFKEYYPVENAEEKFNQFQEFKENNFKYERSN